MPSLNVRSRGRPSGGSGGQPRIPPPPPFKPPPLPEEDDGVFIRPITRTRSPLPSYPGSGSLSPVVEVDTPDSSRADSPSSMSTLSRQSASPRNISPAPFTVSHDTFIKGGKSTVSHGLVVSAQSTSEASEFQATKQQDDFPHGKVGIKGSADDGAPPSYSPVTVPSFQQSVADRSMKEVKPIVDGVHRVPSMTVEPPTPPVHRSIAEEKPTQQAPKVKIYQKRAVDPSQDSDQQPVHKSFKLGNNPTELESIDDEERFPVQEENFTPSKFKRRQSKKIQPKKDLEVNQGCSETKIADSNLLPATEQIVLNTKDLTEKEQYIITEVLNARRSRSRSNSRMSISPTPLDQDEPKTIIDREIQKVDKTSKNDVQPENPTDSLSKESLKNIKSDIQNSLKSAWEQERSGVKTVKINTSESAFTKEENQSQNENSFKKEKIVIKEQKKVDRVISPIEKFEEVVNSKTDKAVKFLKLSNSRPDIQEEKLALSTEIIIPDFVENIADLTVEKLKEHLIKEEVNNKILKEELEQLKMEIETDNKHKPSLTKPPTEDTTNVPVLSRNPKALILSEEQKEKNQDFEIRNKKTKSKTLDKPTQGKDCFENVANSLPNSNIITVQMEDPEVKMSVRGPSVQPMNTGSTNELGLNTGSTNESSLNTGSTKEQLSSLNTRRNNEQLSSLNTGSSNQQISSLGQNLPEDKPSSLVIKSKPSESARDNPNTNAAPKRPIKSESKVKDSTSVKPSSPESDPLKLSSKPHIPVVSAEPMLKPAQTSLPSHPGKYDSESQSQTEKVERGEDKKMNKSRKEDQIMKIQEFLKDPERPDQKVDIRFKLKQSGAAYDLTELSPGIHAGSTLALERPDLARFESIVLISDQRSPTTQPNILQISAGDECGRLSVLERRCARGRVLLCGEAADTATLAAFIIARRTQKSIQEGVRTLKAGNPGVKINHALVERIRATETGRGINWKLWILLAVLSVIIFYLYKMAFSRLEEEFRSEEENQDNYSYFNILKWP